MNPIYYYSSALILLALQAYLAIIIKDLSTVFNLLAAI